MKERRILNSDDQKMEHTARVDISLSHWSRWARTRRNFGLGFPSESREYKLCREGACIRTGFNPRLPDDKEAEKTEQAICEMPDLLKEVIIKYYLHPGSVAQKAGEMNISRVTFHEYLRMAKYWLLGKWS